MKLKTKCNPPFCAMHIPDIRVNGRRGQATLSAVASNWRREMHWLVAYVQ